MKRLVAMVLVVATATTGCAAARAQGPRVPTQASTAYVPDPALMADYIRQLPLGSRVRISLADGRVIHGTLMKSDADPIVVQRRTRIPEAPLHIAVKDVLALELESKSGSPGRAIAMGATAGVAAALGVLLILAAIFAAGD
jgi:hypothetical protein